MIATLWYFGLFCRTTSCFLKVGKVGTWSGSRQVPGKEIRDFGVNEVQATVFSEC